MTAADAAAGPEPDFTEFYRTEYRGQLRRAALLVGTAAAPDVVHDAFVAIWRRWGSIDRPGAVLTTAVVNLSRDRHRTRRRRALLIERIGPRGETQDDPDLDDTWRRVQGLPFNQRAALVLRFHYQLTDVEIANALGCSRGSVGPWIARGLARIRRDAGRDLTRGTS